MKQRTSKSTDPEKNRFETNRFRTPMMKLDWESIAAGLLHDTVEDTNLVTFEKLEEQFGATVRHIVEGETKVSTLEN